MIFNLFSPHGGINSFIPIFGIQLSNKSKFLGLIYLIAFVHQLKQILSGRRLEYCALVLEKKRNEKDLTIV